MARSKAAKVAEKVADAVGAAVAAVEAENDEDEDEDEQAGEVGPLFEIQGNDERRHERTRVDRLEPIHEGFLDHVAADATESDIRDRWGGGKYQLCALDQHSKVITRKTQKISGDPIFESVGSQRAYDRWFSQRYGKEGGPPAATDGVGDNAAEERHRRTLERIRLEIEAKEQAEERRRQREREERKEEREREEAIRRAEREEREAREERQRREDREAREREWKERMELDERRRREDREARETELRALREDRERDRETAKDPTQMLMAGVQLAMSMGGGGGEPTDPVTAFANRLPEILGGAKDLIGSATAAPRPNPGPRPPANGKGGRGKGEPIVIEAGSPLAKAIQRKAAELHAAGVDPDAAISQAMAKALAEVKAPPNGAGKALPPKPAPKTAAALAKAGKGKPPPPKKGPAKR